jgi:hypothetical protein
MTPVTKATRSASTLRSRLIGQMGVVLQQQKSDLTQQELLIVAREKENTCRLVQEQAFDVNNQPGGALAPRCEIELVSERDAYLILCTDLRKAMAETARELLIAQEKQRELLAAIDELKSVYSKAAEESDQFAKSDLAEAVLFILKNIKPTDPGCSNFPLEQPELSPEHHARLSIMREQCDAVARVLSDFIEYIRQLLEASKALSKYLHVSNPTRPSTEEVQRYLRQIEHFMRKRQQAHRRFAALMYSVSTFHNMKRQLSFYIKEMNELKAETEADPVLSKSDEAWLVVRLSRWLLIRLHCVQKAFEQINENQKLDCDDRPQPGKHDDKLLPVLRAALDEVAFAFGYAHEASALKEHLEWETDRHKLDHSKQVWSGVGDCVDWQNCLAWRQSKIVAQRQAAKDKLVTETRYALAVEASEHYDKRKAESLKKLLRIVLMRRRKRPWCNETRVLLNAAAYILDNNTQSTEYPMF